MVEASQLPAETLVTIEQMDKLAFVTPDKVWVWFKELDHYRHQELGAELLSADVVNLPAGGINLIVEAQGVRAHILAVEMRAGGETLWCFHADTGERTSWRLVYPIVGGPATIEWISDQSRDPSAHYG